jgi:hypothetical protein
MKRFTGAIGLLLLGLAACGPATLYNVRSTTFLEPKTAQEERGEQIKRAGAGLGWTMKAIDPGQLEGTLLHGEQRAVVEIRFDEATFAILYASSAGLHYDGTHIDPLYNDWIERLEEAIVALSSVPAPTGRR